MCSWLKSLGIKALCYDKWPRNHLQKMLDGYKEQQRNPLAYALWCRLSPEERKCCTNIQKTTTLVRRMLALYDEVGYAIFFLEDPKLIDLKQLMFDPELRGQWPSVGSPTRTASRLASSRFDFVLPRSDLSGLFCSSRYNNLKSTLLTNSPPNEAPQAPNRQSKKQSLTKKQTKPISVHSKSDDESEREQPNRIDSPSPARSVSSLRTNSSATPQASRRSTSSKTAAAAQKKLDAQHAKAKKLKENLAKETKKRKDAEHETLQEAKRLKTEAEEAKKEAAAIARAQKKALEDEANKVKAAQAELAKIRQQLLKAQNSALQQSNVEPQQLADLPPTRAPTQTTRPMADDLDARILAAVTKALATQQRPAAPLQAHLPKQAPSNASRTVSSIQQPSRTQDDSSALYGLGDYQMECDSHTLQQQAVNMQQQATAMQQQAAAMAEIANRALFQRAFNAGRSFAALR